MIPFPILLAICTNPSAQDAPAAGTATLTVQADAPGPRISPLLYGIFYEEINCAGDGGLYAELVRNRSFEDSDKGPLFWTPLSPQTELALEAGGWPEGEFNQRSLRATLRTGEGRAGISNGGWWGIPVKAGETYTLSLAARGADGLRGPLRVTLEGTDGKIHAEANLEGLGPEWKRFTATLTAGSADPKARLTISARPPGTLQLDMVSLFPAKTFKGHGMREDLARMLLELRPSFVRFPGGCWVEGNTMAEAQRWKQTIGDPALRRTQRNLWGYTATNGLGFHEYLQLCEDLGAEPLFVINCGMSHKENVPLDRMGEYVQDALDAIEYANGPPDSPWGARRARAGHPAPFNLKFIQIGNENGGPAYNERYALFYDAIKKKYPHVQIVACEWGGRPTSRPLEIVDEHYYNNPAFFIRNARKYDSYNRKGHKVYVGEYAVTRECGKHGNLRAAVAEAAFMTGMERNSDIVVMASYAPLFANLNHKRWSPDLINFDGTRVFGTPAYHVQKMFSRNRADVVLPVRIEASLNLPAPPPRGKVGLGTWLTQAEYKDVKVATAEGTVFESDFVSGMKRWKPFKGRWEPAEGVLRQTSGEDDCRITAGSLTWGDYTLTLKARKTGGAEGFLILFWVRDDQNWIWWNLGGWGNTRHALEVCENGSKSILGHNQVPGRIDTGRWYDLRIELREGKIRCFLDGKLVHDTIYQPQPVEALHAVAGREEASGDVILKVVNTAETPFTTQVRIRGLEGIRPRAEATVLTGQPLDENTLDEPERVAPVSRPLERAGADFTHTFPAHSVTVLRLKTR